jgi:hypothetical protein
MNVINPTDTEHEIKIIPRNLDDFDALIRIELRDEDTATTSDVDATYYVINNAIMLMFNLTTKEGKVYSYAITNDSKTVEYRGKIFVTSQTTQTYKING